MRLGVGVWLVKDLVLIFLGVFFMIEACVSILYYQMSGEIILHLVRAFRFAFGLYLLIRGAYPALHKNVSLTLAVAIMCGISLFLGFLLGVLLG